MRKGKIFKPRIKILSPNECYMYQIIESCLKLDLDHFTAIKIINLILNKYKHLFEEDSKTVDIEKMDYRNYRRYVTELMGMSYLHRELHTHIQKVKNTDSDPLFTKSKPKDLRHFENLLFLLNEDDPEKEIPYKKYLFLDTDDLVFRALIQLERTYIF